MVDANKRYYILIDEIQFVAEIQNPYVDNVDAKITFIDVILGFMQIQNADLMENILYNDLVRRGMNVDVGVVEYNTKDDEGKKIRKQLEVDFVVNKGSKRFYIQSALSVADPDKKEQEIASLKRIPDSFSKMVVVRDYLNPWQDDNGITYIGIEQFLLDEDILN